MKVLISAGSKTQNIVDLVKSKFASGGVDFIVVPFIDSIDDIYQRGEYFDKAILVEQCWNGDFTLDEFESRNKINEFAIQSSNRCDENVSFVFLCQDRATAEYTYEEILPIQPFSVVLVKEPTYVVKFFVDLIKTEIDKFPENLVYVPAHADVPDAPTTIQPDAPTMEYEALYDDDFGLNPQGGENGNGIDLGEQLVDGFDPVDDLIPVGEDDGFDIGIGDDLDSSEFDNPIAPEEEPVQQNYPQSGDIPDYYGDPAPQQTYIPIPTPRPVQQPEQTWQEPQYDDTVYGTDDGWQNEDPQSYPQSGEIPDYSAPGTVDGYQEPGFGYEDAGMYDSQPDQNSMYGPQQDQDSMYDPNEPSGYYDQQDQGWGAQPGYGQQSQGGFNDGMYNSEPEPITPANNNNNRQTKLNAKQIRATLDAFANRGNSILLTGCGGCGVSTVALNLANIINNLGYTVLLVDLDTENKTQSYISKDNYDCIEPESASLMAAINSTSGINAHISIVHPGFHLLTMGMASDSFEMSKMIHQNKISRFINLAKSSHNFVIYDVPFKTATGFGKDFTFMADNIVVTIDCSNWGVTKTMLSMCNVEDDDMRDTLFSRGQILFNRYRVLNKVMGRKVKTAIDITKVMDYKVRELVGEDLDYYFQSMHICGLINEDTKFESGWYESTQYSDTANGSKIFLELLKNIVLKR